MKDHFRSHLINDSSHFCHVRKVGLPPVSIAKIGRAVRTVDGMYLRPLLA
jgi:hypothetical protein